MTEGSPHGTKQGVAWLLLPLLAAVAAMSAGWSNGFTNWDDPLHLLANPQTEHPLKDGWSGLLLTHDLGYPVPLTLLWLALERALFGLEPLGYHVVSTGLHAIVALQAAWLAQRLGCTWRAAAIAAAVFAVHPLVVEPAVWLVGQKDLLSALFLLAALIVRAGKRGTGTGRALLTALLVLASLAAKPNTVAAPLLLFGIDLALGRDVRRRSSLLLYSGVLALALLASGITLWQRQLLGVSPASSFGMQSLAETAWAFGLHVRHIVWPEPLLARSCAPSGAELVATALAGVLLAAAACAGVVIAWRRGQRALSVTVAAALLVYAPVSGILPLTRGPADSYLYLPLAFLVYPLARATERLLSAERTRVAAIAAAAVVLVGATVVSRAQAETWRDAPSLWRPVAEAHPAEPRAQMRLGDAYLFVRRPRKALEIYEQIRKDHPEFTTSLAAHGNTLMLLGELAAAEEILAQGCRQGQERAFCEHYGFFLVRHPQVEPSADDVARAAIAEIAPLLAERGKRLRSVHRAWQLMQRYGEVEHAAALQRRLELLRAREDL